MQRIFYHALVLFCSSSFFLVAGISEDHKRTQMIKDLEVIKHHFEVGYAPAIWKKEYSGWDLELAFEQSKQAILETPKITTKQFQQIARQFVNSMQDYHVDIMFYSTEFATLPFSIKGADGRYFIDWIDSLRLPSSHYAVRVGDELLEFDGKPIAELVNDLKNKYGKQAHLPTDLRLAELKLTQRSGIYGDIVPKGPILLTTRSKSTNNIDTFQLHWTYRSEKILNTFDFFDSIHFISNFLNGLKRQPKIEIQQIKMSNPLHEMMAENFKNRNGGLGSQKSFLPMLGEIVWLNKDEKNQNDTPCDPLGIHWHAYIYRHPNGQSIGYIRIPHYISSAKEVDAFGQIMNKMNEETDALVIDQLHNFGGYVFFQYDLASILAQTPLKTPYHRIKITQKEALEAYKILEFIKVLDLMLMTMGDENHSEDDGNQDQEDGEEKQEGEEKKPTEENIRFNYQNLMFLKTYYEFVLSEWNKGHVLTQPTPIIGVDRINPHPKYRYNKPILMLIDEMDFSGGDFMPAILQDNKRAVLFGSRTAGAGGYVFNFQFPNSHGIAMCSYTASIAERTNLQKIENLGVKPDIEYHVTIEDLQDGYQNYVNVLNQVVQSLLEQAKEPFPEL